MTNVIGRDNAISDISNNLTPLLIILQNHLFVNDKKMAWNKGEWRRDLHYL